MEKEKIEISELRRKLENEQEEKNKQVKNFEEERQKMAQTNKAFYELLENKTKKDKEKLEMEIKELKDQVKVEQEERQNQERKVISTTYELLRLQTGQRVAPNVGCKLGHGFGRSFSSRQSSSHWLSLKYIVP